MARQWNPLEVDNRDLTPRQRLGWRDHDLVVRSGPPEFPRIPVTAREIVFDEECGGLLGRHTRAERLREHAHQVRGKRTVDCLVAQLIGDLVPVAVYRLIVGDEVT